MGVSSSFSFARWLAGRGGLANAANALRRAHFYGWADAFRRAQPYPKRFLNGSATHVGPERRKGGKADIIRQQALLDKAKMLA